MGLPGQVACEVPVLMFRIHRRNLPRIGYPLWINLSLIAAAAILASELASMTLGSPRPILFSQYAALSLVGIFILASGALLLFVIRLALQSQPNPIPLILEQVRIRLTVNYIMECVAPLFVTFTFMGAFSSMKALIPKVNPYSWDSILSKADRGLFMGVDPWRITHMVVGPAGTAFLDTVYALWGPLMAAVLFGVSLFASPTFKRRFFLAFVATWIILGLLVATAMSSAGPCFLEMLGDPAAAHYRGLFPLRNAPGAEFAESYLAQSYRDGHETLAIGISAFPSLHVSVSALYVVAFWRSGPIARAATMTFYFLILLGSVHLGWHYLVDGLFGTAGVVAIWLWFGDSQIEAEHPSGTMEAEPNASAG